MQNTRLHSLSLLVQVFVTDTESIVHLLKMTFSSSACISWWSPESTSRPLRRLL